MTMDLIGRNRDSKIGRYFQRDIWEWSALWGYCASISPEAASLGAMAYFKHRGGLTAENAKKLAATLQEQLASGATAEFAWRVEECDLIPPMPPAIKALFEAIPAAVKPRFCFSEDDIREFAEFLQHSGGFAIW